MTLDLTYVIPRTIVLYDVLDAKDWCKTYLRADAYEFVFNIFPALKDGDFRRP